jgi:hypothetical protein
MHGLAIETIAARDSAEPRRYVAAWHVRDAPMLAVSARTPAWRRIEDDLRARRDADVFYHLVRQADVEGHWLFEDHGADGLDVTADGHRTPDVAYESVVNMIVFDGRPSAAGLTEAAYSTALAAAEVQYTHILGLLVTRLSGLLSAPAQASRLELIARPCGLPPVHLARRAGRGRRGAPVTRAAGPCPTSPA